MKAEVRSLIEVNFDGVLRGCVGGWLRKIFY